VKSNTTTWYCLLLLGRILLLVLAKVSTASSSDANMGRLSQSCTFSDFLQISGVGYDANPCSRSAPCKTWVSKTATSGEIDALDPGGFSGSP